MEVRCENGIKFAEIHGDVLEVKCRSSRCGHEPGLIVIHRFNIRTAEPLSTKRFRDYGASHPRKEQTDG